MKETYTRAELLECRMEHSKQLHRMQASFERREQALHEYWMSQVMRQQSRTEHKPPVIVPHFHRDLVSTSGGTFAGMSGGRPVKIDQFMFKNPEPAPYHHDMSNLTFKPTPPLLHRSAAAAADCRARVVKRQHGVKRDTFVDLQPFPEPKRVDIPRDPSDPWVNGYDSEED
uniref:Uncharacterized protein n=2 Tax=Pyramimonas obovata TaxID=1411642 RepID=A0A7S0R9N3_9CHLO|mmetsp:Transcript_28616/g.62656  ORF Transcript_28616/g.62656 Transcript_28616/m.62656 type:complete len:171 (+) Transcript_28616:46-558(+)